MKEIVKFKKEDRIDPKMHRLVLSMVSRGCSWEKVQEEIKFSTPSPGKRASDACCAYMTGLGIVVISYFRHLYPQGVGQIPFLELKAAFNSFFPTLLGIYTGVVGLVGWGIKKIFKGWKTLPPEVSYEEYLSLLSPEEAKMVADAKKAFEEKTEKLRLYTEENEKFFLKFYQCYSPSMLEKAQQLLGQYNIEDFTNPESDAYKLISLSYTKPNKKF